MGGDIIVSSSAKGRDIAIYLPDETMVDQELEPQHRGPPVCDRRRSGGAQLPRFSRKPSPDRSRHSGKNSASSLAGHGDYSHNLTTIVQNRPPAQAIEFVYGLLGSPIFQPRQNSVGLTSMAYR